MNEILQKRIEEKSKELGQMFFPDNMNVFARPNWEAGYIETACKEIANFALQNQWISVDEDLPDDDENVFIMNEYGGCGCAHYDYNNKIWRMSSGCNADESDEIYSTITHWMEIPKNK